jgi:predicted nucleic acid-binding protein
LELFAEACRHGNARGNLVFDAQIAALLWEHGVEAILTEDRDFERFKMLRVVALEDA